MQKEKRSGGCSERLFAELMSTVVHKENSLRTERRINHAFLMAVTTFPKPFIITDAAINIRPTLEDKRDIVQNAIDLMHIAQRRQTS